MPIEEAPQAQGNAIATATKHFALGRQFRLACERRQQFKQRLVVFLSDLNAEARFRGYVFRHFLLWCGVLQGAGAEGVPVYADTVEVQRKVLHSALHDPRLPRAEDEVFGALPPDGEH
ncbi:MAG: hypothetical protein GY772_22400 [bacterium]|nr:hypothetical protein [bacterium]